MKIGDIYRLTMLICLQTNCYIMQKLLSPTMPCRTWQITPTDSMAPEILPGNTPSWSLQWRKPQQGCALHI